MGTVGDWTLTGSLQTYHGLNEGCCFSPPPFPPLPSRSPWTCPPCSPSSVIPFLCINWWKCLCHWPEQSHGGPTLVSQSEQNSYVYSTTPAVQSVAYSPTPTVQSVAIQSQPQCTTTYEEKCTTVNEQECTTGYEDKCPTVQQ